MKWCFLILCLLFSGCNGFKSKSSSSPKPAHRDACGVCDETIAYIGRGEKNEYFLTIIDTKRNHFRTVPIEKASIYVVVFKDFILIANVDGSIFLYDKKGEKIGNPFHVKGSIIRCIKIPDTNKIAISQFIDNSKEKKVKIVECSISEIKIVEEYDVGSSGELVYAQKLLWFISDEKATRLSK
jgi:hypothetical protein